MYRSVTAIKSAFFNNFPIFDLAVLFFKLLVNQPFHQHTEYAGFWID